MSTTEGNYPEAPRTSQNLREPLRKDNKRIIKVTGVSNFNDVKAIKAIILSPVAVTTQGAPASAQCRAEQSIWPVTVCLIENFSRFNIWQKNLLDWFGLDIICYKNHKFISKTGIPNKFM
ncbi:hypothetical protein D5086_002045 [Populus alba]|uniref:Uncharacterized protein n=1 Tax=Populus alba TaxID=43335 RepID=A0ACC4D229_POPAL